MSGGSLDGKVEGRADVDACDLPVGVTVVLVGCGPAMYGFPVGPGIPHGNMYGN